MLLLLQLLESFLIHTTVLLCTLVIAILAYFKWKHQYWRRKGLEHYPEPNIPWGTLRLPDRKLFFAGLLTANYYEQFKAKGAKHVGLYIFEAPGYLAIDLEYVKHLLTKDYQYFNDRGFHVDHKKDPLQANLFSLGGDRWKELRSKLSPSFSSGKLKGMFNTIVNCLDPLQERLHELCQSGQPVDIKDAIGCYTTDVIGSCAFGLDCNSFKDANNRFRIFGKKFFAPRKHGKTIRLLSVKFPLLRRYLGIGTTPESVRNFFTGVVKKTIQHRSNNNIQRNDFMQLLMELMNNRVLNFDEVAGQSYVFFLAGFETSSTTSMFTLYLLAKHQEIQERARTEINSVLQKYDGEYTYEALQEMSYLEQVVSEALRLYPPVTQLSRSCLKDYKIPDQDLIIEKGTSCFVSVYGMHHDPEYFPDPEKFDPDRFSEENKSKIKSYTYMPFGEGPRICIGLRFGMLQTKIAIASVLKSFRITVNEKTTDPIEFDHSALVLAPKGDIWLNLQQA